MTEAVTAAKAPSRPSNNSSAYFAVTTSTLSKRPMSLIMEEGQRKKGTKHKTLNPATKKIYTNIVSKLDTGVKKKKVANQARQSNDLTCKKKDELYGRVSGEMVARFLSQKLT